MNGNQKQNENKQIQNQEKYEWLQLAAKGSKEKYNGQL